MNDFDEWSLIISKCLKSEADFLTTVAKHEVEIDAPRETFIRSVLELFLPSSYAIGSGVVIDSDGQSSRKLDLVIYRRDFPRLNLPGSADRFLHESVLATIEVRPKLVRKTLFDALDACASLSELNPAISEAALANLAEKNGLARNPKGHYVHQDPLLTARFNLVGRPPSFIFGFNGFKTSFTQLAENIEVWIENRRQKNLNIEMKSFPAIIATQGCFGCRNAAPLSAKRNHLFGIGVDDAPIRLIVLHLLYALNRRLKITSDGSGLKPGLDAYLMKILPPDIQYTMGRATNAVIRTGIIAEQVVESSPDEDPAEAVFESVPDAAVVEEEVVNSVVDDEPVAEESSEEKPVEAVFETVPTASAVEADVETAGENESFDPFSELEADSTGIESKFVQTVTEEDFVDPLIDTQMVEAAAEAAPAEHVFDEEEAPDPFAEMELIDPETEDALADSDTEEEFAETVKIAGSDADSEEDFTKTVIIKKLDLESGPETEKPAFEQDYISTPAAPNAQKSS